MFSKHFPGITWNPRRAQAALDLDRRRGSEIQSQYESSSSGRRVKQSDGIRTGMVPDWECGFTTNNTNQTNEISFEQGSVVGQVGIFRHSGRIKLKPEIYIALK